jgi:hypothetical protein
VELNRARSEPQVCAEVWVIGATQRDQIGFLRHRYGLPAALRIRNYHLSAALASAQLTALTDITLPPKLPPDPATAGTQAAHTQTRR